MVLRFNIAPRLLVTLSLEKECYYFLGEKRCQNWHPPEIEKPIKI